jgi:hypothetical protein
MWSMYKIVGPFIPTLINIIDNQSFIGCVVQNKNITPDCKGDFDNILPS